MSAGNPSVRLVYYGGLCVFVCVTMADGTYRRCTKIEWSDASTVAGAATPVAHPGRALVNNVVGALFAATDKKALLVGGVNPKTGRTILQSLEYDLTTKQWGHAAVCFPAPVSDGAMVSGGSVFVAFGGFDDETVNRDLYILPQRVDETGALHAGGPWLLDRTPSGPSARRGHSMVATPTKEDGSFTVYLFGGFDMSTRLNDLWSISIASDGQIVAPWSQLPCAGDVPQPRDAASFAYDAANNRLVLFGGFATTFERDLLTYDLTTLSWSRWNTPLGPSKRQLAFGVCHQHYFLTVLGNDGKAALSQVCQLSMPDSKWCLVPFEGDEIEPRLHASCCTADNGKKVLVFGGQSKGRYLSSLLELELEKGEAVAAAKGKK